MGEKPSPSGEDFSTLAAWRITANRVIQYIISNFTLYGSQNTASPYFEHTLHLGASHPLEQLGKGKRGTPTVREETRLYGETKRRHLGLPILHVK